MTRHRRGNFPGLFHAIFHIKSAYQVSIFQSFASTSKLKMIFFQLHNVLDSFLQNVRSTECWDTTEWTTSCDVTVNCSRKKSFRNHSSCARRHFISSNPDRSNTIFFYGFAQHFADFITLLCITCLHPIKPLMSRKV